MVSHDGLTGRQGGGLSILYIKFIHPTNRSDFRHCGFNFVKGQVSMNIIEKSKSIRGGLQKGFRDGTSKMAQRRCYGYDTGPDGELVINPDEATVVHWIFDRYLSGNSLGKIATGLEEQGIPSPTGKPKWNREAINKLISNEKYTGRVLLQKSISVGGSKIKNNGFMERYLYSDSHEAIISDETFRAAQQEKFRRTNCPKAECSMQMLF